MSTRNTVTRSLHDVGAAVWLGGSLMGAVGLNGAASDVEDPSQRSLIAADGWARWSPVTVAAVGAHLIGGAGLLLANRNRVRYQSGVTANTIAKSVVTIAAMATTAYSGILGAKIASAGKVEVEGATTPGPGTSSDTAAAQHQLRTLQWVTPLLTSLIVILGAQQGEQQRPAEMVGGLLKKAAKRG